MHLHLWSGVLWRTGKLRSYAYCPEHRIKLEILMKDRQIATQDTSYVNHKSLICPLDKKLFPINGDSFWTMQRRFSDVLESTLLKDAQIVDIDGYQIPIAKTDAPRDEDYWVQARINDTKRGKQLVVYAGKRGASDKAQIFIDTENDKISFDQNNIHPNDIFTKIVADFATKRRATMESDS